MPKEEKTFEEAVKELEEVLAKLEDNELTLDESVDLYKKGMDLSHFCKKKLEEAQEKIAIITEENENTEK